MRPDGATPEATVAPVDSLDWLAQRCAAAEELWTLGYTPESYAILRNGLSDAARVLHEASGAPSAILTKIEALLGEATALGSPRQRAEFTREHAAWLERARAASHDLQRELARARGAGARRFPFGVAVGAVLLVAAAFWFRAWEHRIYASSPLTYAAEYPAKHAVDGQRATEWLLPDGKLGHLDLALATRRAVHGVSIINAHNRHYMDRAIKRAQVVVFDDRAQVDRAELSFDKVEERPAAKHVTLRGREGTRVRIVILEYFGLGGGIADVSVD